MSLTTDRYLCFVAAVQQHAVEALAPHISNLVNALQPIGTPHMTESLKTG